MLFRFSLFPLGFNIRKLGESSCNYDLGAGHSKGRSESAVIK